MRAAGERARRAVTDRTIAGLPSKQATGTGGAITRDFGFTARPSMPATERRRPAPWICKHEPRAGPDQNRACR